MGDFGPAEAGVDKGRARAFASITFAVLATTILFSVLLVAAASAATPTILNTSSTNGQTNWLESFFSSGETNNSGNKVRISLAVKHDPGRKVTGLKIDDDWDGTDNTTSKAVKNVTAQQPTVQGGYDHSRVTYEYTFPTANTGMSCGAFGIGGTNKATKQIRVRAVLDNAEETATSSSNIIFTRTDCTGGEDFPYLYQWGQTATSVNVGGNVTFTFRGDDSDSNGNADFAGINWRMRRLSDGATTTPQTVCYPSGQWDNQDKSLTATFPSRGRWVVEAELLNNDGCAVNNNAGSWAWIGAVDVNSPAADSPTANLSATRPQIGGNTTISATFADGSDNAQGGRVQNIEWDLDGNTANGVNGFEIAELGAWNTGLTSPRTRTIGTAGMTPGLKTVRARVTDNGALLGADNIRRTRIVTTTYLIDTPPVATAQATRAVTGKPHQITLAGTDVDGDTLAFGIDQQPEHGTVTVAGGQATYTSDPDFAGTDSFTFEADDGFGGTDTAEVELRVDPSVEITEAPTGISPSRGAGVEFGSPVAGATFECSFDGGGWNACESPRDFTDLPDGQHDLRVRVSANGLTNPDVETAGWQIDAFPEVLITDAPGPVTAETDATVEFVSSEAGATVPQTTSCRFDGGTWRPCESPHSYTDLDDGEHRIQVRATDAYGKQHVATHDWTVSAAPPSTGFADPLPATLTSSSDFEIAFGASDPEDTFECRLDDGDWNSCVSPAIHNQLPDGPHVFRVRAVNDLGVPDPFPAVFSWTIDTAAPQASVLSGPAARTKARRPAFDLGSSEPGSVFECAIDSTDLVACQTPFAPAADLDEGDHVFRVAAIDRAGNRSAVETRAFTVDLTAPPVTLTDGPEQGSVVNSPQAQFTFGSTEAGATFTCRIDQGDWAACASPRTVNGLGDGEHSFQVRAADSVGNVSAPASRAWSVDTVAPATRIVTGPSGVVRGNRAAFGLASDEPGSRFHCSLDQANYVPCQAQVEFGDLSDGPHELRVRATDPAGNQDPGHASRTWTVDTSPLDPPDKPVDPKPEPDPVCVFGADLPKCGSPNLTGTIGGKKNPALGFEIDSGGAGLGSANLVFGAGAKAVRTKSKKGQRVGSVTATGGTLGTLALKLPKKRGARMVLAQRAGATVTLTGKRLSITGLPAGTDRLKLKLRSGKGLRLNLKRCGTTTWRANLTDAKGNRASVGTGVDRTCTKTRKGGRK